MAFLAQIRYLSRVPSCCLHVYLLLLTVPSNSSAQPFLENTSFHPDLLIEFSTSQYILWQYNKSIIWPVKWGKIHFSFIWKDAILTNVCASLINLLEQKLHHIYATRTVTASQQRLSVVSPPYFARWYHYCWSCILPQECCVLPRLTSLFFPKLSPSTKLSRSPPSSWPRDNNVI